MKNAALFAAAGMLAAGAYLLYRQRQDGGEEGGIFGETVSTAAQDVSYTLTTVAEDAAQIIEAATGGIVKLNGYSYDKVPEQYRAAIRAAEVKYGIPRNMLARLLWQESRYREDIISGRTRSSVGAAGIAQFMPATAKEMGIDPLNPFQSIDGAGRYLSRMYAMFASWTKALAAYNWGPGNVQRKGIAAAPRETRNYYGQILADIGMAANIG